MNLQVEIRTELLDKLQANLGTQNLTNAMQKAGDNILKRHIREQFQTSKDAYGKALEPLAQSTLDSNYEGKKRSEWNSKPLNPRGKLRDSFTAKANGSEVVIGTDVSYYKYHQGDPNHVSKGIIPKRAMLPDERGLPGNWSDTVINTLESEVFP